jgi:hypothetical protein
MCLAYKSKDNIYYTKEITGYKVYFNYDNMQFKIPFLDTDVASKFLDGEIITATQESLSLEDVDGNYMSGFHIFGAYRNAIIYGCDNWYIRSYEKFLEKVVVFRVTGSGDIISGVNHVTDSLFGKTFVCKHMKMLQKVIPLKNDVELAISLIGD